MRWTFITLAVACLMSACGHQPVHQNDTGAVPRLALEPRSLGRSLSLSQLVTGEYQDHTYQMRYEIDIQPERLGVVGLSPLGITLFMIIQEHGAITSEVFVPGEIPIDPDNLILDLHLIYWPSIPLQEALENIGMRLDETADKSMRRIRDIDGNVLTEILYKSAHSRFDEISVTHFDYGYRLKIHAIDLRRAR
jgi:hypothetical protein